MDFLQNIAAKIEAETRREDQLVICRSFNLKFQKALMPQSFCGGLEK